MPHIRRRDAVLDLSMVVLAAIVLPYLPTLLIPLGPDGLQLSDVDPLVILHKWCEAALAAGLLLYFVLRHSFKPTTFGLRHDRPGQQILWGLATLGSVYVALIATSVVVLVAYFVFPEIEDDLTKRAEFVDAMPVHDLATTLILLVAVAVHEEVLFRGLLLPYLRRVLGSWWSAGLISALIFATLHVPHQGILGGLQVFGIGVVLTLFFVLSRSLPAVVLAHLMFDFIQFQFVRAVPDLEELLEGLQP
jgi:membrane protease YdiL (CAAX protease family)